MTIMSQRQEVKLPGANAIRENSRRREVILMTERGKAG
jgi:hypothetical protein